MRTQQHSFSKISAACFFVCAKCLERIWQFIDSTWQIHLKRLVSVYRYFPSSTEWKNVQCISLGKTSMAFIQICHLQYLTMIMKGIDTQRRCRFKKEFKGTHNINKFKFQRCYKFFVVFFVQLKDTVAKACQIMIHNIKFEIKKYIQWIYV